MISTGISAEPWVERDVPVQARILRGACWGVHTVRALESVPIGNAPLSTHPELVAAGALSEEVRDDLLAPEHLAGMATDQPHPEELVGR